MSQPHQVPCRRRALSLLSGSAITLPFAPALFADSVWEIVKYQGREYVTASSVEEFYRFQRVTRDGNDLLMRSSSMLMKWRIGQQDIFINNIKFGLSFPIVTYGDDVIISRVDLQKLLDPVLRPWYISNTEKFSTVTIDAGHGGHDAGAIGKSGHEKDYALDLALRLKKTVEKAGLKTHMTRDTDKFISLPGRVRIANDIPDSIFVSIHFNAGNSEAQGIETYALAPQGTGSTNDGSVSGSAYSGNQRDGENIALATAVHAMVMASFNGLTDRGIKRARFNVLRGIDRPAILFEGGFITNSAESRRVHTADYRQKLADAITGGILNFRKALK